MGKKYIYFPKIFFSRIIIFSIQINFYLFTYFVYLYNNKKNWTLNAIKIGLYIIKFQFYSFHPIKFEIFFRPKSCMYIGSNICLHYIRYDYYFQGSISLIWWCLVWKKNWLNYRVTHNAYILYFVFQCETLFDFILIQRIR